jgi:hypothetical protein
VIDPFPCSLLQLSHRRSHTGIFIIVGDTRQLGAVLRKANSVATQNQHSITSASCFSDFKHFRLTAQHRCQDARKHTFCGRACASLYMQRDVLAPGTCSGLL